MKSSMSGKDDILTYPSCFYSNRVEQLYEAFAGSWRDGKSSDVFARRLVLLSSMALKGWLCRSLARDSRFGIAAGLEFSAVMPALEALAGGGVPPLEAISLAVELLISKKIKEESLCEPLYNQLGEGGEGRARRACRLAALAQQLAHLFKGYGTGIGSLEPWQEKLWNELITLYPTWRLPRDLFSLKEIILSSRVSSIHLFAVASLPTCYWQFLIKLSQQTAVYCYFLSPCQLYWGDQMTPGQRSFLMRHLMNNDIALSQKEAWDSTLNDSHPLLGSWGKVGREFLDNIAIHDPHPSSYYYVSANVAAFPPYCERLSDDVALLSSSSETLTALEALQADLVLLQREKITLKAPLDDKTIQLHAAPSRWREVEALYDALMCEVMRQRELGIELASKDILIAAPDIELYAPYLNAIFGSEASPFSLEIIESPRRRSAYLQALEYLIALRESRWESRSLLQLLDYAPVRRALNFSNADVVAFKRWTAQAFIDWGVDHSQRKAYLQKRGCRRGPLDITRGRTWREGLARLLEGIVMNSQSEDYLPFGNIDITEAPLLGRWIALIEELEDDLSPIADDETLNTTDNWIAYLHSLMDSYLAVEDSPEDSAVYNAILSTFSILSDTPQSLREQKITFSVFYAHFYKILMQRLPIRLPTPQGILCGSMSMLRALPASVIALLGIQDDFFPRKKPLTAPSQLPYREGDEDRHLFLEYILSAKTTFLACCCGRWDDPAGPQAPSSILFELKDYLNKAFGLSFSYQHPSASYHYSYFTAESQLKSLCPLRYRLSKSYYLEAKLQHHHILTHSRKEVSYKKPNIQQIALADLAAFAKAPIRYYLRKNLGIYLKGKEESDAFTLSHKDAYLLRYRALKEPWERLRLEARQRGELPFDPIGAIYCAKVQREVANLSELLMQTELQPRELHAFEFTDHCFLPERPQEGLWLFPPLILTLSDGQKVSLQGRIDDCSKAGLVVFSREKKWNHLVRHWPNFLAYCASLEVYGCPYAKQLIPLSYEASSLQPFLAFFSSAQELLAGFVEYFLSCQGRPSPLMPEWLPAFINKDSAKLNDMVENARDNLYGFTDEYLCWLLRHAPSLPCELLVDEWQDQALKLFGPIALHWS